MAFLSATCIICERVLRETDNVLSAIRIVNVFTVQPIPDIAIELQATPISILGTIQFSPDDEANHSISLVMIRPDGEESEMPLTSEQVVPPSIFPEMPRAAVLLVQLGVLGKGFGVHKVVLKSDGVEVVRAQFLLKLALDVPVQNSLPS
jgi:hypothetical protein